MREGVNAEATAKVEVLKKHPDWSDIGALLVTTSSWAKIGESLSLFADLVQDPCSVSPHVSAIERV